MPKIKRESAPNVLAPLEVALAAIHPDVPEDVQAWADADFNGWAFREFDFKVVVSSLHGTVPDADGFIARTCPLTDEIFRVKPDALLVMLASTTAWSPATYDREWEDAAALAPRLVAEGEPAVRAAMADKAAKKLREARRLIREAASLTAGAESPLAVEWPVYFAWDVATGR